MTMTSCNLTHLRGLNLYNKVYFKNQLQLFCLLFVFSQGCFDVSASYGTEPDVSIHSKSHIECQQFCQNSSKCQFWSWSNPNSKSDAFNCSLWESAGLESRMHKDKVTSGLRVCKSNYAILFFGKKYIFLTVPIIVTKLSKEH